MASVLQARHSSCSQRGPTCPYPCPPSRPTATATQRLQATPSRHSPTLVTACEDRRPRKPPRLPHHHHHLSTRLDSFLPSVFFFVFLTSVPWSSTHNRGHKQATAHFDFECYICFIIIIMIKVIIILLLSKKTFICIKGLLFVFYWKKPELDHELIFTFHIYDYFTCFSLCVCVCVYVDVFCCCCCQLISAEVVWLKLSKWTFEVGGGALDFALEEEEEET